jgi:hypothetical protein
MQKNIDAGVDSISAQIKQNNARNIKCWASHIDRSIAIVNISIQYIIIAFVVLALFNHDTSSSMIVQIIQWTTYVSLVLLALQYRNAISAVGRLANALDTTTKIVIILSVLAALGTGYIKKGQAGVHLTIAITMILFVRLSLQMKDFLMDKKTPIPAFLKFVKELLTPERIRKIYTSF